MTDIDQRRRRAAYRAAHRGTKEMDWLLGRYCDRHLAELGDKELAEFEALLAMPDPELQTWILSGTLPESSDFHALVERIRAFHGLGRPSSPAHRAT